ncbi:MAG: PD-(D/E)XK motif protein [Thermoplasmata archaeon]
MKRDDRPDWEKLEADMPIGDLYVARSGFPEITDLILAAIDSSGNRHFLVPLESADDFVQDRRSRGISANVKSLHIQGDSGKGSEVRYIDIRLEEESEREMFDIIGRQVALALRKGNRSRSDSVRTVLAQWRHFWGTATSSALSREEIVGLFSELWFITKWILPVKSSVLVYGWRGPYGGRNDFEWKNASVEVKGTTVIEGIKHWVNGIDQLSPPDSGKLYLFSLKMREENGAIDTLPGLIRSCIKMIRDDPELSEFVEETIARTGYSPAHDDIYDRMRFRVTEEALYEVRDRFPRITSASFPGGEPDGVERIQYQVNLEGYGDLIVATKPREGLFSDEGLTENQKGN